ncbi:FG-GAP repeat domain-containing protein [Streptomyces roseolus]|uniref:FG-GAP repeat domain-containing protein n=1 Tax=Streptomyces roseolus TaxID=67358 RepID=UPI0037B6C4D3
MSSINRRGLRLASALVAAGLALSAAPVAAQADDPGLLTLTDAQAETLTGRFQPDVYGDGAHGLDALDTARAAQEAAGQDAAESAGTDTGTAADTGTSTGTAVDTAAGSGALKMTHRSAVEGVQGAARTIAVGGTDGDYFTVHALGVLQRTSADGKRLWKRDSASLHKDWQVTPTPRAAKEPYPAAVVMGFNAVSPFDASSDDGYATGDLTGDGVDDIVFTAKVGVLPYRPFTSPGSTLPNGTFVTVLDGSTGRTLWSKLYAGAYNVELVGGTLVVADSPFYNVNSPAGSKTTLHGIRFSYADGRLTPADTWTYDAGTYTGVAWGSLEPIGDGLLAASWNQSRRYAPGLAPSGHTLVIDTADGSVRWEKSGRNYVRQLRLDDSRGRIVALEQSDYSEGMTYEIAGYALADGGRTGLGTRVNAVATAVEIADIQGDDEPEYTVAEATLSGSGPFLDSSSVRALNGDDASPLWARTVKPSENSGADASIPWDLRAVDGRIVASYLDDRDSTVAANRGGAHHARLAVLAGNNGAVKWEKRGIVGAQIGAQAYAKDGGRRLRTVDTHQNIHVYNLANGKEESLTPLQGPVSSAVALDVTGDKKQDVVVGGVSRGLFAYDGPSTVSGTPKPLWTAALPGQVNQIVKADTDGDGDDELVVAADTAAAIVDAATGKVLTTIDGGGEYVRNVVASDLDGDGAAEVAVATDKVRAYEGTGALKWEWSVPAEIGTPAFADLSASEGRVYAQYQTRGMDPASTGVPVGGVGLNGADGSVAWSFAQKAPATGTTGAVLGIPLRAGTFAGPGIPYADGHAVVFTYVVRGDSAQAPPNQLANMVQIRDSRTGEVLHESKAGGYATLANWYTAPEGLIGSSLVSLRTYAGDPTACQQVLTLSEIRSSALVTGPGGRRLVVAGGETFAAVYDASILTSGVRYPASAASYDALGAREFLAADLDGDGREEVVLLNWDGYGADRSAALVGNAVIGSHTALRSMITLTIDNA